MLFAKIFNIDKIADMITTQVITYGPKVLLAIITFIVGRWIIKKLLKVATNAMAKSNIEQSLSSFLKSLINVGLNALLIVSVASMVGIETTSFVAILGAAGLAVGLALQGSLSNFAGGVLILVFKPFKVGDLIETQGHFGEVQKILIFYTVITTLEGKSVILPNSNVTNGAITNHSENGKIRVEVVAGVAYGADLRKAKKVLEEMLEKETLVMKEPAPSVSVIALADSSVNLTIRPWCKPEDYWTVFFDVTEKAKLTLDQHDIEIPFPQQDVYIKQHTQG
ncbi:mechanosensitive ion channel family protein [Microscilla marina]|uniref:Mechanosensitive ion channel family protein n=1 Tax=Microscilla marina ATCC 23134 TaxID=313606 RepID=A1ZSL2_MICM2|nr:mechanosensitive ion channel domain-containing protein [Microscilla marina]EAY26592.1 mechanosensitive ion channel family protein [Microscilla marina ATCC 23134]